MKIRALASTLLMLACADNPFRGPTPPPLPPPPPRPTQEPYVRAEGSLWAGDASRRFLAFENRAQRVGDHVTVLIAERSEAENNTETNLKRTSNYDATLDSDVALQTIVSRPFRNILGFLGFTDQKTDKDPSEPLNIVNADTTTKFNGNGTSARDANFTTTLTCIVTEVTEAGTLRIEGSRRLDVNNESEIITLTGYVRPEDIRIDNTVPSPLLALPDIRYGGAGPLSGNQQTPWLTRIFHVLLPF